MESHPDSLSDGHKVVINEEGKKMNVDKSKEKENCCKGVDCNR